MSCRALADCPLIGHHQIRGGSIMAKSKKGSKVQKRAKARRGNSVKRSRAHKRAQAKTAKAKTKRKPAKKTAPRTKKPAVETVIVDLIEQPAPGVITVTEIEETVQRGESPSPG
jgi:hypothetical protein